MVKNKKIESLSGLGIFLVVVGHSQGVLPETSSAFVGQDWRYSAFLSFVSTVYTFHMPLFFFISGYLFLYAGSNADVSWKIFLKKKFVRLIVPYICISSIAFPLKTLLSKFAMRPVDFSIIEFTRNLIVPWNNAIIFFWFLPTLFVIFVIARPLVRHDTSRYGDVLLLLAALLLHFGFDHVNTEGVQSFLNVGGAAHNFIFFLSGSLVCKHWPDVIFQSKRMIFTVVAFALLIAVHLMGGAGSPLLLVMACFGVATSCFLVGVISSSYLGFLGRYSYQIYLLSWFPQIFVRILFGQVLHLDIWLCISISIVSGILAPVLVAHLFQKFNFALLKKILGM